MNKKELSAGTNDEQGTAAESIPSASLVQNGLLCAVLNCQTIKIKEMSDKHEREPIKHTCPDIDKYIKRIKWEIATDTELKNLNENELFDAASSMRNQLEECIDYLEELRNSNHTLRMWGIEEADEVDSLNNYVQELEEKLNSIKVSA